VKAKLDKYEQQLEKDAESFRPVSKKKRLQIERILESARKTKNVNIRISEADLAQLKQRSFEEGLPYQTLIASVLHRFVTNRLVDEKAIRHYNTLVRSRVE
jgi:predicted DNA binding CopG/RHH family protein